ncbi:MAG: DNA polymerase IV [Rubricoccaceae bacterium]|nr:DNA polymerase IV [Rubricoccaceae bacterium]
MAFRRIAHVDLDAFYASVEQRDDPALRGRPVAVGGRTRGVVMAASYEARAFGVRSAMPVGQALRRCPDLVCVKPRFEAYKAASEAFHGVLAAYAERRDVVGLDEAYLDLSDAAGPAAQLGASIRADVLEATGLTASVGVAPSKFVAKVASAHDKPDGLTVVPPPAVRTFLAGLPVERFHGVGPATAARLARRGIQTGADLQRFSPDALEAMLGRTGRWLARLAAGDDDRRVGERRARKSVGAERTYFEPLRTRGETDEALEALASRVAERMARHRLAARTVTLKARSPSFETVTRRETVDGAVWTADALAGVAGRLLHEPEIFGAYRLLGVSASNLVSGDALVVGVQLRLPL